MDSVEMTLLLDYYGELLTERQRQCFDLRYNQDLSLGEIAEELGVSRQGVFDNLSRAEQRLRNMEEKTGCVRRAQTARHALDAITESANQLRKHADPCVAELAERILSGVRELEE